MRIWNAQAFHVFDQREKTNMTVENLALKNDGKNTQARNAAIARRATMDVQDRKNRETQEKDSFIAFGANVQTSEQKTAIESANHPFTD